MRARTLVFAAVIAVVLAVPTPARPATSAWPRPIWVSAFHDGGPSGLTADARGAVVTTDAGRVRAIGRHGATQWETKVDGMVPGNPALTKDLVLIGATGRVVALSRHDGAIRWRQPMDGDVYGVAVAGAYALAGDDGGTLRAFGAADGVLRWEVHHEGELRSSPRLDPAASVVVAVWYETQSTARALDLATGAPRWEQPVGLYTAAPAGDRGRTFLATGDGRFHAWIAEFDVAAGGSAWALLMPASFRPGVELAVDAHDLVMIDQIGRVTAVDPRTGDPRWTQDLNRRVFDARVVLLARRVVVTTHSGELFVLDRVSGRVVARADIQDFGGRPVLAAAFGGGNEFLVLLRVTDPGRVALWRVP